MRHSALPKQFPVSNEYLCLIRQLLLYQTLGKLLPSVYIHMPVQTSQQDICPLHAHIRLRRDALHVVKWTLLSGMVSSLAPFYF
jgi:hypothetical protein